MKVQGMLFVPSSTTQFLYQIAAARDSGLHISGGSALSNAYLFDSDMEETLKEIGAAFNLQYLGNLTPTEFQGHKSVNVKGRLLRILYPPVRRFRKMLEAHGLPRGLHCDTLICCIRPTCYDELLLWEVLRPADTILVIDGVNPKPPSRSLEGPVWFGVNCPFRNIPTAMTVNCPAYLGEDAKQLGLPRLISDDVLRCVFSAYRQTAVASRFGDYFVAQSNMERLAMVFSQHLSLSGHCSPKAEISHYMSMVSWLIAAGWTKVLVKAHPRDPREKMHTLAHKLASKYGDMCFIVPDEFKAVAMEPFLYNGNWSAAIGVSVNSSLLLSFRRITDCQVIALTSKEMSSCFLRDVSVFCDNHLIPRLSIP